MDKGLDAVTITPAILSKGKPPPISQGNFVMINSSILFDPNKNDEYIVANAISTILHEGFHLTQFANMPKGQEVKPIKQKDAEIDAYTPFIYP
jgi:hypothetical protein